MCNRLQSAWPPGRPDDGAAGLQPLIPSLWGPGQRPKNARPENQRRLNSAERPAPRSTVKRMRLPATSTNWQL